MASKVHAEEEKLESGDMLPYNIFKFGVPEMPSPAFSAGHVQ